MQALEVTEDHKAAAVKSLGLDKRQIAEISLLGVNPAFHRRGVASALMKARLKVRADSCQSAERCRIGPSLS